MIEFITRVVRNSVHTSRIQRVGPMVRASTVDGWVVADITELFERENRRMVMEIRVNAFVECIRGSWWPTSDRAQWRGARLGEVGDFTTQLCERGFYGFDEGVKEYQAIEHQLAIARVERYMEEQGVEISDLHECDPW